MEKVLVEEERMRQRKKQQPLLWDDPKREKSKVRVHFKIIFFLSFLNLSYKSRAEFLHPGL